MPVLLTAADLAKSFGPRQLFRNISLSLSDNERVGLIGPNGSGKSTLLKILANEEHPDEGALTPRRNLRLAYVPQEESFDPSLTVEQVLATADALPHADEHDRALSATILLSKLNFPDASAPVSTLSGGWRKRLAVARALLSEPDLLLMDEPTNHLDVEGILWLENLLSAANFACLLVSHDRYFLERVTTRLIELSRAYPQGYFTAPGPYSAFLIKREEFLTAQAAEEQSLASQVRREIEWLQRGAKARTTKAKGRIQQAGQMMTDLAELKTRNTQTSSAQIDFTATTRQTRKLLEAKNLSYTFPAGPPASAGGSPRTLFTHLNLTLTPGIKLGLLGPNGAGKSTLLRILAGDLPPTAGQIRRADNLRIVYFDQARQHLDKSEPLRRALAPQGDSVVFNGQSQHVVGWARRFLFRSEQLDMPVSDLSGGEQARVLIAQLMLKPADVLLLDEPTNDLDINTLEVLEDSLAEFPGALVLVTHDRYLIDRLATELLAFDANSNIRPFATLAQWEASLSEKKEPAKKPAASSSPPKPKSASKKLTWNEQREFEQMEAKILAAEEEVARLQSLVADPNLAADHKQMHTTYQQLGDAQQTVETLYARWTELEEKQGT